LSKKGRKEKPERNETKTEGVNIRAVKVKSREKRKRICVRRKKESQVCKKGIVGREA